MSLIQDWNAVKINKSRVILYLKVRELDSLYNSGFHVVSLEFLHTVILFKTFLSNTNNYMVSSTYFYLIIVICLHTVTWFQEIIIILSKELYFQVTI